MAGRKSDFTLTKLDDLFSTQEQRDEEKLSKIRDIPLTEIDDFPDHPFKVRDDEDILITFLCAVAISHMRSREYRATFLMFLEIAAVAVLLLVFFKIFARTFHDNAVIFITEHFDCFNKKAPSKATIAACLTER